mmetsp:Transcript_81761/g.212713  ORF Transcript_81761/g.212713 Transcript_81761/m.212713 type:complete len:210 (-) Transcript_81761:157-786(-)
MVGGCSDVYRISLIVEPDGRLVEGCCNLQHHFPCNLWRCLHLHLVHALRRESLPHGRGLAQEGVVLQEAQRDREHDRRGEQRRLPPLALPHHPDIVGDCEKGCHAGAEEPLDQVHVCAALVCADRHATTREPPFPPPGTARDAVGTLRADVHRAWTYHISLIHVLAAAPHDTKDCGDCCVEDGHLGGRDAGEESLHDAWVDEAADGRGN